MQHGWISRKARAYMLNWLISYINGRPVQSSRLSICHQHTRAEMAAMLFPGFLDRQQLDGLWDRGLYFLRLDPIVTRGWRWNIIPWWHINAERGDIEAIQILLDSHFARPTELQDAIEHELDVPTPLMRAIAAGHRDLAVLLIQRRLLWMRDTGQCSHRYVHFSGREICGICQYGQDSAHALIFGRGEVELMEVMIEHGLPGRYGTDSGDLPRVLSCANIMMEWLTLRSTLSSGLDRSTFLQMETDLATKHAGQVPGTREEMVIHIQEELAKLRAEMMETRESWLDRAKTLQKETGKTAILPIQRVTVSNYGWNEYD